MHDLVRNQANQTFDSGDLLDRMQFVRTDPYEEGNNDKLFEIINSNEILRNGDDICEGDSVCRIENLFVGLGCRGNFFSPERYGARAMVADISRGRMMENVAQSREIYYTCRVQVTIVLRYPHEGRAFDAQSVNRLAKLINDNFGVPVRTVYMQEISLKQQLRLLHDTSVLIAMDGSVLDLVPAMRDSSAVITIVPERREYLHWRLSQSLSSSTGPSRRQFYALRSLQWNIRTKGLFHTS